MNFHKMIVPIFGITFLCYSCKFKHSDNELSKPGDNNIYSLLTGSNPEKGKTWKLSANSGISGIGGKDTLVYNVYTFANISLYVSWLYAALQNIYTFTARNNQYIPNNRFVTVNFAYANRYFNAHQIQYTDTTLLDVNHKQAPSILREEHNGIGTGYTLEITNGSYIGRFDKRNKYQIVSISNDCLRLRHHYSDDPNSDPKDDPAAWYSTYVIVK